MGKTLLFNNTEAHNKARRYKYYMENSIEKTINDLYISRPNSNRNTGTYIMTDTLASIVKADEFIPRFYDFNEHVDTVVTNILHRIGGNIKVDIPYWENILNHAERVVPLTLGFSFENDQIAKINKELKRLLEMFAERIELGVRTEYDAELLVKNGIKNVQVIGCPSLYYHMNRDFKVDDNKHELNSVNFNFTTDFANLGISQRDAVEIHWPMLLYFIWKYERNECKVDYTMQKPPFAEINDIHSILLTYGEVHRFYSDCGRYFYNIEEWINGIKNYNDFSMGSRFHGNVAAILAGVPTLMVNVDKRMKGMNDFYKIPSIDISEFDMNKPLEYYRELADYTEFNKNYSQAYDKFVDYCEKNNVPLNFKK